MNKITMTLGSIFLASTLNLTGYAQEAPKDVPNPPSLTEEQKSEMAKKFEAEYKEMQEKFSALSDEEKKEIYDLYDKVNVAKMELLDKYVELGLMTEEEANAIQEQMSKHAEKIRNDGQFIGFKPPHSPKHHEKTLEPKE